MKFNPSILLLVILAIVAAPNRISASAASSSPFFQDNFGGTSINSTIWDTSLMTSGNRWCSSTTADHLTNPGTWQNVTSVPCAGDTQSTPYGSLVVSGGSATFSSAYSRTFPYIWRGTPGKSSPFPSTGDFTFEVSMQYTSLQISGDGFIAEQWDNTTPTGNNPPIPGQGTMALQIWADSGSGVRVSSFGRLYSVPDTYGLHTYTLTLKSGTYSVSVDGVTVIQPFASTVRPNAIWIGHPALAYWWLGPWTSFRIESVRVDMGPPNVTATVSKPYLVLRPGSSDETSVKLTNNGGENVTIDFNANLQPGLLNGPRLQVVPGSSSVFLNSGGSTTFALEVQTTSNTPTSYYSINATATWGANTYWNQTIPVFVTSRNFVPGITIGTMATYNLQISGLAGPATATTTVTDIQGSNVTYQITATTQGQVVSQGVCWIDITVGDECPSASIPGLFIATGYTAGDSPFLAPPGTNPGTLSTTSLTVPGGHRLGLTTTVIEPGGSLTASWDRATGLLTSLTLSSTYGSIIFQLTSTNAWSALSGSLTATHQKGLVPLAVQFEAKAGGGEPDYSFHWDFGDGKTSTQQDVSHTYNVAGNYTVTLTITDSAGNKVTRTTIVNAQQSLAPSLASPFRGLSLSLGTVPILIIGAWLVVSVIVSVLVVMSEERKRRRLAGLGPAYR